MLCKSEVTAVLQRCSTAYHVAKSGFDSCILSFFVLKNGGNGHFVVRDNRFYLTMCNLLSARCDHKICEV